MVANAMSMSLSLPAWTTRICCPTFRAASCTSRNRVCKFGLFGLTSTAMTAAVGTSSRISSSRFDSTSPKKGYPREVASRSAEAGDETVPDRVATDGKDDGNCRGRSPGRNRCGKVVGKDGGHLIANQLGSEVGKAIILVRIPQFDDYIASFDITQVVQALAERCQAIRHRWLSRVQPSDNRDRCLLRTRRERPRGRRPAEQRDELAALHSITSSARPSGIGDTSRPSVLAVLRLIASSNFVGCWTGRSDGFSPRRIRSTYAAARRY